MSVDKQPAKNRNSSRSRIFIICLAVLILLVLVMAGVIIFLLTRPEDNSTEDNSSESGGRGTVVTESNVAEIQESVAAPVEDGYYVTSMSIDWHFDGLTSEDAYVENAVENTRTVYFDLFRLDTSELIYSSPYIPVGEKLSGVVLDKEVEPGTYDTILVYHLVDDDKNELSTLSIALTIYVE